MHRYATLRYAVIPTTQWIWVMDHGVANLPRSHCGKCKTQVLAFAFRPNPCLPPMESALSRLSEAARAAGRLAQVSEERCHHRGFAECSVSRAHAAVGARCSAPLCGHVASKQDWKGKGWWIGLSEGRWCENRIGWGNIEGLVDRIE